MSDAFDLIAAQLLKDSNSYQQEDPFYMGGQGIDAVLATMPKYNLPGWQAALAGALGGFASGALKGYGQASADQKTSSIATKLAAALEGDGSLAESFGSDPELQKYKVLAEVADLSEKRALKKQKAEMLAKALMEKPDRYEYQQGEQSISMERTPKLVVDPQTGEQSIVYTTHELGRGSKFAPRAETALNPAASSKLAQLAAALQGEEAPDEGTTAAYSDKDTGRMATALLQQQGVQGRFNTDQPTQRKLAEKKTDAQNFINSADQVLDKLGKFDKSEDVVGALSRAAEAGIMPNSEAADLNRMLDGLSFEALKPTFPGAISDQERQAIQQVMGRQSGVTVGKLKEILERQQEKAKLKFDTALDIETERGIKSSLKPFRDEASQTSVSGREFDTPPSYDRATQKIQQNPRTGKYRVVPR